MGVLVYVKPDAFQANAIVGTYQPLGMVDYLLNGVGDVSVCGGWTSESKR